MKSLLLVSLIIFTLSLISGGSYASAETASPGSSGHTGHTAVTGPLHKKFNRHTTLGNRFYESRDYDRALTEYYIALKYHNKMISRCNRNRGRCGHSEGFIRDRSLSTHLFIGRTLFALGDYDGATSNFDIVIGLDANDLRGYYERGRIHALLGNRKSAISDYDMLIELDPDDSSHYIKRAYIFLESGNYGRAIEDYTMVIEIDPEYTNAYSQRGELYFKHFGDRRRACSDWRVSCELGECSEFDRAKREGICD